MKKFLLASSAFVALAINSAVAADMAPRMVTKAAPLESFSWAGMYIGAHGGYAWGHHDFSTVTAANDNAALRPTGGFGGGQIGYNAYIGRNWILGSEVDISFGRIQETGATPGGVRAETRTDYFGTARARLGYATGQWLLYGTAGAAWAHNEFSGGPTGATSRDQFHMGWTVGGGIEYALNRNWSVKAEYLYADLGTNTEVIALGAATQESDMRLQMARLGINYRFDGSAPSAAAAPGYPVKARPLAVAQWGGSYIGAHGGYGWSDMDTADNLLGATNRDSLSPRGAFGGITTGYNWLLSPNWLVGLESETSYGSLKTDSVTTAGGFSNAEIKYFGTERARLGYVAGDWLVYGTGGLAWARVNYNERTAATSHTFEHYQIGWAAGGVVEYMFAPNWSAKVEYLHSDYGTYASTISGAPIVANVALKTDTVKAGINYHGDILGLLFR